jgi:serine/threonine protein kinase/tetratricopeptide (TPR) repeat protein
MAAAWSRGHHIRAVDVIERHPGIDDEAAVRLIYEEVSLRRESGEEVHTAEVIGRYPRWKDELQVLLGCERMLRPLTGLAHLPEVGEDLGPFHLRAELGRGASGKTYLASEPTLADRTVVLKVISDEQEEHLSLARLQHTHIIPLFSEHSFPERGLRALCMPYLGGTSLARILDALAPIPPADRRGRDIIHVLDRVQAAAPAPAPQEGPYRRLEQWAYVDAICFLGSRLADALHEAHAHGLVHMDVKPSNVLIAADGSPMLLDFHLACRPIAAGERFPDRIGGTPGWMAPEHRAALDAVAVGDPVPEPVDHRADLYALGLLLRDALGGAASPGGTTSLRRSNPAVGVGLELIIRKCLADRPDDRYKSAAALAEDLRRHLEHLPLRGVPNRLHERLRKRWRRGPIAVGRWVAIASVVLILAASGLFWAAAALRAGDIRADLEEGRALCQAGHYADADFPLRRGLDRALAFPRQGGLAAEIEVQLRVAHRGQRADALHKLAEQARFRCGMDPPAADDVDAIQQNVRKIWDDRHLLISRETAPPDPKLEARIRADLLELMGTWAELHTRTGAPADSRTDQEATLAMLDEARSACGPSLTIDRIRRSLAERLGRAASMPEPDAAPLSTYDHYDLGRSLLGSQRYAEAIEHFRLCLDRHPKDFWANFYRGLCEYRLRHYQAAESAFGICIVLAPAGSEAKCYHNRAMAAEALGRDDEALHDYSQALERDPGFTAARLNRGILSFKSGRHAEAIADLRRALKSAAEPKVRGRILYNLALVHLAAGDRDAARASAEQAIDLGYDEAWNLRDRLRVAR